MTVHVSSIHLVSTIFSLTYLGIALGEIPGLRIDRAGIALVGAAAMLACGVLSMHDAARAVDYETIVLAFRHDGGGVLPSPGRVLLAGDRPHRRPVLRAARPAGGDHRLSRASSRRSWSMTSSASR